MAEPRVTRSAPSVRLRARLDAAWWVLGALVLLEVAGEIVEVPGVGGLFAAWVQNAIVVVAAVLCLAAVHDEPRTRGAWLAFGAGLASWAAGSVIWTALYGTGTHAPYPTIADVLWLAWYPLTAIGIALLIRAQVTRFELHRWMDGIGVALLVLIPGAALVLQPVADRTHDSTLAAVVDFSYPILDAILLGAILGMFAITGWRPGRVWLTIGFACIMMTVSDAAFAVEQASGAVIETGYDFLWSVGAVLFAYAAWLPIVRADPDQTPVGWRAIALPLAAQLIAAAIQVYGLFGELARSERVITLAVLAIASIQIVISRPRAAGEDD